MLAPASTCASLDDYLRAFDITLSRDADRGGARAHRLRARRGRVDARTSATSRCATRRCCTPARACARRRSSRRCCAACAPPSASYGIRYGVILCAHPLARPRVEPADRRAVRRVQEPRRRRLRSRRLRGQQPGQAAPPGLPARRSTTTSTAPPTPASRSAPTRSHQAIHKCGAHRIGHGTRLVENGDLLNYVNDHRIPLEVCPSSNVQTSAAPSWETHPVDFYVDYGLRVTINTDNRLITDTTVSKELWLCHKHYGWSLQTIKEIIIAGFKSAFMPYREKADLLAEISAELATIQAPTNGKVAAAGDKPAAPVHGVVGGSAHGELNVVDGDGLEAIAVGDGQDDGRPGGRRAGGWSASARSPGCPRSATRRPGSPRRRSAAAGRRGRPGGRPRRVPSRTTAVW